MLERVGHYRILHKLGEGGMGVVYAAHDERLDRPVAIKMIRGTGDEQARKRLWREARAAAGVNHPNVCQLYEIGEENGQLFIAMELLEGESLADRIKRGPLGAPEAVRTTVGILAALEALHRREFVHRDLKPSNVFLTEHGVKLLDFGLARPLRSVEPSGPDAPTATDLTVPGTVLGTPHYMAPEQLQGETLLGPATDLFAAGAVLYEMLTGDRAFPGNSMMEVFHAVLSQQPPALGGSPAIAALDRIARRAMGKRPADRYPSAEDMARELQAAMLADSTAAAGRAQPVKRLIVLPFRLLRPDTEIDFLAFSLPDAVTSSLSGLGSLVVRSSLAAAKFAGAAPDLKVIAAEADVDVVLTGTLLRAGEQLRVSTQLMEAPSGTVLWSQTSQGSLADVFQLQDELVERIVKSLALPLTAGERGLLKHDVPASPLAYEYYLRANQLGVQHENIAVARDLYLRCVQEDPRYAPAWARLARCHRLVGKWTGEMTENLTRAEEAFRRALDLNPDLPVAHNLYAQLETDLGRARDAMIRLLRRAQTHSSDPELFAGLVHTCRYCGLLAASVAAHHQARSLDPHIPTSVDHTFFRLGQFDSALQVKGGDSFYMKPLALAALGRPDEALALLRSRDEGRANPVSQLFTVSLRTLLEGKRADSLRAGEQILASPFRDGEGFCYLARQFAYLEEPARALEVLRRGVDGGFFCFPALARDPWLDSLRANPEFTAILNQAEARHREAAVAFREAGGDRLLGVEGTIT